MINEDITTKYRITEYKGILTEDDICAISRDTPEHPVKTSCGHLFDKENLKTWVVVHETCPTCREQLRIKTTKEILFEKIDTSMRYVGQKYRAMRDSNYYYPVVFTTFAALTVVSSYRFPEKSLTCLITGVFCR